MDAHDLEFPVVAVGDDGNVTCWEEARWLSTVYLSQLRHGYLSACVLVDRTGREFSVTRVESPEVTLTQRALNILWGQRIPIRLSLSPTGANWDVTRLRRALLHDVEDSNTWGSRADYDEVLRGLRDTHDFPSLMDFFVASAFGNTPDLSGETDR